MFQWVNIMRVDSRPYTSPIWMGIRGEVSEFTSVKQARNYKCCCDGSGLEKKARRYIRQFSAAEDAAAAELSLARCIRSIAQLFCAKGGCDNTKSERVISILNCWS